ncbi:MAG TPA: hypothetical protein DCG69_00735 [Bacteroidales bacterium]|nr:hypothetical protein [Bacteroidales bacterium]
MKKLTVLFLAVLVSGSLFAQLPSFGIKAGATASSLNTSDLAANYSSDNLLGYQLGAFVRLNSGKLYLQPEVVYNHRSTQLAGFEDSNITFDIGTIDVPVLVGFKLLDAKVFNLRAFLGPEASFATGDGTTSDNVVLADFNKLTWYMQAGVGIDLLFLTFDVRYEKGLSNFINDYQDSGSLKNNVFVFSLGLKFM